MILVIDGSRSTPADVEWIVEKGKIKHLTVEKSAHLLAKVTADCHERIKNEFFFVHKGLFLHGPEAFSEDAAGTLFQLAGRSVTDPIKLTELALLPYVNLTLLKVPKGRVPSGTGTVLCAATLFAMCARGCLQAGCIKADTVFADFVDRVLDQYESMDEVLACGHARSHVLDQAPFPSLIQEAVAGLKARASGVRSKAAETYMATEKLFVEYALAEWVQVAKLAGPALCRVTAALGNPCTWTYAISASLLEVSLPEQKVFGQEKPVPLGGQQCRLTFDTPHAVYADKVAGLAAWAVAPLTSLEEKEDLYPSLAPFFLSAYVHGLDHEHDLFNTIKLLHNWIRVPQTHLQDVARPGEPWFAVYRQLHVLLDAFAPSELRALSANKVAAWILPRKPLKEVPDSGYARLAAALLAAYTVQPARGSQVDSFSAHSGTLLPALLAFLDIKAPHRIAVSTLRTVMNRMDTTTDLGQWAHRLIEGTGSTRWVTPDTDMLVEGYTFLAAAGVPTDLQRYLFLNIQLMEPSVTVSITGRLNAAAMKKPERQMQYVLATTGTFANGDRPRTSKHNTALDTLLYVMHALEMMAQVSTSTTATPGAALYGERGSLPWDLLVPRGPRACHAFQEDWFHPFPIRGDTSSLAVYYPDPRQTGTRVAAPAFHYALLSHVCTLRLADALQAQTVPIPRVMTASVTEEYDPEHMKVTWAPPQHRLVEERPLRPLLHNQLWQPVVPPLPGWRPMPGIAATIPVINEDNMGEFLQSTSTNTLANIYGIMEIADEVTRNDPRRIQDMLALRKNQ